MQFVFSAFPLPNAIASDNQKEEEYFWYSEGIHSEYPKEPLGISIPIEYIDISMA